MQNMKHIPLISKNSTPGSDVIKLFLFSTRLSMKFKLLINTDISRINGIFRFMSSNKNIKMSSFKSSENIQKKEGGSDRSVSDNQSSSVTLNERAMKARKILKFRVSARMSYID